MSPPLVLLADDDRGIRTVLVHALGRAGFDVRPTGSAATLWTWAANGDGDVIITDVVMPDGDGLDLLPRLRKIRPDLPIIVMSARNTLLTAVRATERGAYEYLPKPFDINVLTELVKNAVSKRSAPHAGNGAPSDEAAEIPELPLVGRSPAMQEVYRIIARLLPTDLSVMISGESGTGKELVARAIHDLGKRRDRPFVAINMAAIPRELVESELFGHEKGAFTGASQRRTGRFEQAQGGTLFLDEIGDMSPEAQTRLLRVLQEGEYSLVGGRALVRVDVRIIAATNQDLRHLIDRGRFREDLFYRLNVVPLRIPPLRERLDDIPELARRFAAAAVNEGLPAKTLTGPAIEALKRHGWPGNVRELENLVRRLAALYSTDLIGPDIVNAEIDDAGGRGKFDSRAGSPASENLGEAVEGHLARYFEAHEDGLPATGLHARVLHEVERPLIAMTLALVRGNQLRAAEILGLNRNTLRKKIRDLDIPVIKGLK